MNLRSKLTALLLSGAMVAGLAACGGGTDPTPTPAGDPTPTPDANPTAQAQVYNVGICQLAPHPALDAATQGFKDALNALLPGQVNIDEANAAGDVPTCSTIVNRYVSNNVDLIMANATSPLQAAATATADIPVLGTSVTEYGVALGIENFSGTVGTNVSGTSDLAPLDQQAAMFTEWFPNAKNIGLLYCSAEPNSQYQVDVVKAELEKAGYTCTLYPFADTNDMASVTQTAASSSDALYVPTDNTLADNTGIVDNICRPAGVPVIAGEEGICSGCGVATLSISYYDIGYKTGEMAAQILTGEADIATMPIQYAPQFTAKYNAAICADLGLTPPDGYEAISAG